MNKIEAIAALEAGHKVTHRFMEPHEWIAHHKVGSQTYATEDGYNVSRETFWKDRQGIGWNDGWELFHESPESKPISQQLKEIWDLKSNTRSGVDYGKSFEKLKEDLAKIPELTKRYNENYALGYLTASVRKHLEVCTIEMVEEKESSEVLFLDGTLGPKDDDTFDPPENDVPEELFRSPAAPEGKVSDNSLLHY